MSKPRIGVALLSAFAATTVVYALLMALGSFLLAGVKSFSLVFGYMGLLAPVLSMYVAFQVLRFFRYPAETGWLAVFALAGFLALSAVNLLMGYVNAAQGSTLAWNFVSGLAIVHLIVFVCPVVFFGRRLLYPQNSL